LSDSLPPPDAPGDAAGGVLVIGYGNALRSDDGVGVHAARLVADDRRFAGADIRVLALHQLGPELALDMSQASLVVLIDASAEDPAGSISTRRLTPDPGRRAGAGPRATSHHVGVEELVGLARELYGAAPEVVVVSVGVATMEAGEVLSPAVTAALPGVVEAVADLIADSQRRAAARQ